MIMNVTKYTTDRHTVEMEIDGNAIKDNHIQSQHRYVDILRQRERERTEERALTSHSFCINCSYQI